MPPYPQIQNDDAELERRTLGDWTISPDKNDRAKSVQYVAGVYKGLIRCVYKVTQNNGDNFIIIKGGKNRRVRFLGKRDQLKEQELSLRRICDGEGNTLSKFARRQPYKLVGINPN